MKRGITIEGEKYKNHSPRSATIDQFQIQFSLEAMIVFIKLLMKDKDREYQWLNQLCIIPSTKIEQHYIFQQLRTSLYRSTITTQDMLTDQQTEALFRLEDREHYFNSIMPRNLGFFIEKKLNDYGTWPMWERSLFVRPPVYS